MNLISYLAQQIYYSPLSLAIKALILSSLKDKQKPFDEDGNIIIPDFESKLEPLLDLAKDKPHQIMNEYGIKNFIASKSWVYKVLFERRGKINEKQVDRYLTKIADAAMLYGQDKVLNMDETFVCTWNPYYVGNSLIFSKLVYNKEHYILSLFLLYFVFQFCL